MTKTFRFYSAVIVNGKEYNDHEMAQLIGQDVTGWRYAGDCDDEEANFCISDDDGMCHVIGGRDALPRALAIVDALLKEGRILETD